MKRMLLTTVAICAVLCFGLTAQATTNITFNVTSGNWNTAGNWDLNRVPADGDNAIIPTGRTCYVDINNARADSFTVQGTGVLSINTNCLLEIDSASSVAGTSGVVLSGSASTLKISGSLTISGAGSIDGQNSSAVISIPANNALTLDFSSTDAVTGSADIVLGTGSTLTMTSGNVSCDDLAIPHDATADVGARTLTSSGVLDIHSSAGGTRYGLLNVGAGSVTLTGSNKTHTVDGQITLAASGSDLTINGSGTTAISCTTSQGTIFGCHDSAVISIASAKTLANAVTIKGHLEISGQGSFTNQYVVESTADPNSVVGTLKLAVGGTLSDNSSGKWKATAANAILDFDSSIGTLDSLQGEFVISGSSTAKIEVREPLTTTGRLDMSNGTLDVIQSVTMGDGSTHFMSMTGGQIVVASTKTFTHL